MGLAPALAGLMLVLAVAKNASAHGVVGDRIFLSPIIGNDAFPDNAFDLGVRRSDYQFSLMPELEKQLSEDSSLLLAGGWSRINPGPHRQQQNGPADLALFLRKATLKSVAHELEFTVSPFLLIPTGNQQIADQGYTHLGGELLLGKGMGDLPQGTWMKYMRPVAVQAEAGYAARVQGPANSDLFANLEMEYSLQYLNDFVRKLDLRPPVAEFVPFVQFNYAQSLIASRLTTSPDFRITPGLAYLGNDYELSAGAQAALNGAAPRGDKIAVIGLLEVFYDNIFPALGWNPF